MTKNKNKKEREKINHKKITLITMLIIIITIIAILVQAKLSYYDPNSNIAQGWNSGSGTSYTEISKTTRQPTAPNTGTSVASTANAGQISEFGFPNITDQYVENITLWVYTETGSNAQYTFSLRRGTTTLCDTTINNNAPQGWRSCTWANPSGDLSSLSIHLSTVSKIGGGQNQPATIYAVYLAVDQGPPEPNVTLNAPAHNNITDTTPIQFNFTAVDQTYSTLNCTLYANFTGTWEPNTTLTGVQNNTRTNISISPNDGVYVWNVNCTNSFGRSAFAPSNRTIYVNVNKPLMENEAVNQSTINQTHNVLFNVTITDSYGIDISKITMRYPNDTISNITLTKNGDEHYHEFLSLNETGTYNITTEY